MALRSGTIVKNSVHDDITGFNLMSSILKLGLEIQHDVLQWGESELKPNLQICSCKSMCSDYIQLQKHGYSIGL